MGKGLETTEQSLGVFEPWKVSLAHTTGFQFLKKTIPVIDETGFTDDEEETEMIRLRRNKKVLTLTHVRTGEIVEFSRYLHRGEMYWRDSRDPISRGPTQILTEAARLLGRPVEELRQLMD